MLLCLATATGYATGGAFTLEVKADGALVSGDIRDTTMRVVTDELNWAYQFSPESEQRIIVEIEQVTRDSSIFPERTLIQIDLSLSGPFESFERTIAFLSDSPDTWEDLYEKRLRLLIRQNSRYLLPSQDGPLLTHVYESGLWTTCDDSWLQRGTRIRIADHHGRPFALLEVTDRFIHTMDETDSTVTELVPLYSSRPLTAGMPLTVVRPDISLSFSLPVSQHRAGIAVALETALLRSRFRLSGKLEAQYRHDTDWYEYMVGVGLSRRIALGQLTPFKDKLGKWWTNVHISGSMHVSGGMLISDTVSARFLYGAEVAAEVAYQANSQWYWGVSVGYRYRASVSTMTVLSEQSNLQGITISPTVGWIW